VQQRDEQAIAAWREVTWPPKLLNAPAPYAPELNPVERGWGWIKNGPLANCCVATLAELTGVVERALGRLLVAMKAG